MFAGRHVAGICVGKLIDTIYNTISPSALPGLLRNTDAGVEVSNALYKASKKPGFSSNQIGSSALFISHAETHLFRLQPAKPSISKDFLKKKVMKKLILSKALTDENVVEHCSQLQANEEERRAAEEQAQTEMEARVEKRAREEMRVRAKRERLARAEKQAMEAKLAREEKRAMEAKLARDEKRAMEAKLAKLEKLARDAKIAKASKSRQPKEQLRQHRNSTDRTNNDVSDQNDAPKPASPLVELVRRLPKDQRAGVRMMAKEMQDVCVDNDIIVKSVSRKVNNLLSKDSDEDDDLGKQLANGMDGLGASDGSEHLSDDDASHQTDVKEEDARDTDNRDSGIEVDNDNAGDGNDHSILGEDSEGSDQSE